MAKIIINPAGKNRINKINRQVNGLSPVSDPEISSINTFNDVFFKGKDDRMRRYDAYDAMDADTDISRALDMIAEHCTNRDVDSGDPFKFDLDENELTVDDTDILNDFKKMWCRLNDWDNRIFRTVRNVIKYGDAFFLRDPESFELKAVNAKKVVGVYVNQETQEIEGYLFKDLNFFFDYMIFDVPAGATNTSSDAGSVHKAVYNASAGGGNNEVTKSAIVPAEYVLHLSLAEGREIGGDGEHDDLWPFGESFLEQIYKDFKNRELLEQAAIIHRIQRAPSRRVWYIDVGKARPDKANAVVEKLKNKLLHKSIPENFGGKVGIDSAYNPLSTMEDIYLPQTADGRGSKVDNLEGQQWNGLDDLKYFTSKVMRGLRVPSSFLLGPEEGGASYNDGRVGTAFIQEIQFARFCMRIQELLDNQLDREFKLYLKARGMQIHSADYELKFLPPMNFEEYREGALDEERLGRLGQATGFSFMSIRFAMAKYGRFTPDEILENERLLLEERQPDNAARLAQDAGMGGMGVGSGTFNNFAAGADPLVPMDDFGGEEGFDGLDGGGDFNAGAGAGAGAAAAPTTPAGTESYIRKTKKDIVMEEIEPVEELGDNESEIIGVPADKLFGNNIKGDGILSLKHLRKLRIEKEKSRRELLKRLSNVSKIYSEPADSGPGF